jgi:hypothetical protein
VKPIAERRSKAASRQGEGAGDDPRVSRERKVQTSSGGGRVRHWWQARPMAGLIVGWVAICVIGWRVWAILFGHHA